MKKTYNSSHRYANPDPYSSGYRRGGSRAPLIFAAALFLFASVTALLYAVLPSEARYVLTHCTLTDPASPGRGDGDHHDSDSLFSAAEDVFMLYSARLGNITDKNGGIICVEAGTPLDGNILSRAAGEEIIPVSDLSLIPSDDIGYYRAEVLRGGKTRKCVIIVTDTGIPSVTLASIPLWTGDQPRPEAFVSSSDDETRLLYTFLKKPDCTAEGTTEAVIGVCDRAGNTSTASVTCEVLTDTEPPVISGVTDKEYYIGSNVLFKEGVSVYDNRDGDRVALDVDISAVDQTAEGDYPVVFTATDSSGLTSSATATFSFRFTREDRVRNKIREYAAPIIDSIITDGMTEREKAEKIYYWVRKNITYVCTSNKGDYDEGALDGFEKMMGDCFTYSCVAKALYEQAGFECIIIPKEPTKKFPNTHHYWNMVKVDGEWYHVDTYSPSEDGRLFLVTTDYLLAYSRTHDDTNYYTVENYPQTP